MPGTVMLYVCLVSWWLAVVAFSFFCLSLQSIFFGLSNPELLDSKLGIPNNNQIQSIHCDHLACLHVVVVVFLLWLSLCACTCENNNKHHRNKKTMLGFGSFV